MTRFIILVLFLGLIFGWLWLRFDPESSFAEGMVGQPVNLIPGQGDQNPIDQVLERLLFRPLFTYDANDQIVPDLVEDYSISKDGRIYDLTLKEAYWRDGRQVTSTDVISTFTQDPAFSEVAIEQEGDRKIRFILRNPLASFLSVLTAPIGPANYRDLPFKMLGDGDYYITEVKAEGRRISQITIKDAGGNLKELIFKFFQTEDDLAKAASLGEIDALTSSEFSSESFSLNSAPDYSRYFALFFNLEGLNPLAKSREFRTAAFAATPFIAGAPVSGPFSGTWAQGPVKVPKKIKKFSGTLSIVVPEEGGLVGAVQKVAASWEAKLGITVTLVKVSNIQLEERVAEREFEAIILGQDVGRDPDRYNLWHSTKRDFPGQNISAYANARADRALEEGRMLLSRKNRLVHYRNFQQLFYEDNPAVFLYHPVSSYWVSKKFTGIDLAGIFEPGERFWNFEDWDKAVRF